MERHELSDAQGQGWLRTCRGNAAPATVGPPRTIVKTILRRLAMGVALA